MYSLKDQSMFFKLDIVKNGIGIRSIVVSLKDIEVFTKRLKSVNTKSLSTEAFKKHLMCLISESEDYAQPYMFVVSDSNTELREIVNTLVAEEISNPHKKVFGIFNKSIKPNIVLENLKFMFQIGNSEIVFTEIKDCVYKPWVHSKN